MNSRKKWKISLWALAIAISSFVFYRMSNDSIPLQISKEAAEIHRKVLNPEVNSISLAVIQDELKRLGFRLIVSQRLLGQFSLVGGRHSSILGVRAAQLELMKVGSRENYTLFQIPIASSWPRENLDGIVNKVDGFDVKIWIERNLLLVLVGS